MTFETALKNYKKGHQQGAAEGFLEDGYFDAAKLSRRAGFEAIGLSKALVDRYFTGTASRIEGVGLDVLAREAKMKHDYALQPVSEADTELDVGGSYQYRVRGEYHLLNPDDGEQAAARRAAGKFPDVPGIHALVDSQSRELCTLRGLMQFKLNDKPVPIEEVEPARRSSSALPPAPCRSGPSVKRRTKRWPSR
jgi:glutamate synthase (NADPH/NADH) large chain